MYDIKYGKYVFLGSVVGGSLGHVGYAVDTSSSWQFGKHT